MHEILDLSFNVSSHIAANNQTAPYVPGRPSYISGPFEVQTTVARSYDLSSWGRSLDRMRQLEQGWDGHSAPIPSRVAIVSARDFLSALTEARLQPSLVEPRVQGGVRITHAKKGRQVHVEFFNDGIVCAIYSGNSSILRSERIIPYRDRFRELTGKIGDYLNAQAEATEDPDEFGDEANPRSWRGVFAVEYPDEALFVKRIDIRSNELAEWVPEPVTSLRHGEHDG